MSRNGLRKKITFLSAMIMTMLAGFFCFFEKVETLEVLLPNAIDSSLPGNGQKTLNQDTKNENLESDLNVKKRELDQSKTSVPIKDEAYRKDFEVLSVDFTDDNSIFSDELKSQLKSDLFNCGLNISGFTTCPQSKLNVAVTGFDSSSGFDGNLDYTFFQYSSSNYFYIVLRYIPRVQDRTIEHILKIFGIKKSLPNPLGLSFQTESEFHEKVINLYKAGKGVPRKVYSNWLDDRYTAFKEGFENPIRKAKHSENLSFEDFNQMLVSDVGLIHIADIYISDHLH